MNIKNKIVIYAVLSGVILIMLSVNASADGSDRIAEEYQVSAYRARVTEVLSEQVFGDFTIQTLQIRISNREHKNLITTITNTLTGGNSDVILRTGSRITVIMELDSENNPVFYFYGYDRTIPLAVLFLLFLLCIVIFGRTKGFRAITALTLTILLVLFGLVPLLLRGYNPIILSIITCVISAVITFTICFGVGKKSFSALIGVSGGLLIAGIIAHLFGIFARISGIAHGDAQMLQYLPNGYMFDFRGMLFAGIIIGASGACTDVAISISSALTELKAHHPNISRKEIIQSGFNIGRDIMGSMVDTLVLAYTGSSLTTILVLVGFEKAAAEIINLESIATEILRAVAGSIGLIFAIPITVFAFILLDKKKLPDFVI